MSISPLLHLNSPLAAFREFDFVTVSNGLGLQIQKHLLFILLIRSL